MTSPSAAASEPAGPSSIPNSSTFRKLPGLGSHLRRHERSTTAGSGNLTVEGMDAEKGRSSTFSSLSRMLGGGESPSTKVKRGSLERDRDGASNLSVRSPSRTSANQQSQMVESSGTVMPRPRSPTLPAASKGYEVPSNLPSFSAQHDTLEPITYPSVTPRIKTDAAAPSRIVPSQPQSKLNISPLEPPISLEPRVAGSLQGTAVSRDGPGSGGPPVGIPKRSDSVAPEDASNQIVTRMGDGPYLGGLISPTTDDKPPVSFPQSVPMAGPNGRTFVTSSNDTPPSQRPGVTMHTADIAGPSRPRRSTMRGREAGDDPDRSSSPTDRVMEPCMTDHTDVTSAPASAMYYASMPSYGHSPSRPLRAHTGTLVGDKIWFLGGVDGKRCWRGVAFLDTETHQWQSVNTYGDQLPPLRAHTTTAVGDRLYIFGGGDGPTYSNEVWLFDTVSYRFSKPKIHSARHPPPRRAHTTVLFQHYLVVFGGGNGQAALNDLWALDLSDPDKLAWQEWRTTGDTPQKKGYHTANLVGEKMIVYGGSDGHASFADVHVLNLRTLHWTLLRLDVKHNRLSHTSTQVGSYLFILGGHSGQSYVQDVLLFNLVTLQWESKAPRGQLPPGRGYHVALLHDARIIMFGGYNGAVVFDDLWTLELGASAYLPQVTTFEVDETLDVE